MDTPYEVIISSDMFIIIKAIIGMSTPFYSQNSCYNYMTSDEIPLLKEK